HEDTSFKELSLGLKDGFKELLNLDANLIDTLPTEIQHIDTQVNFIDQVYNTDKEYLIHLEFQSTNKGKSDLRRFRYYNSNLSMRYNKDVYTYVIYTGKIKSPITQLKDDFSSYSIKAICMSKYFAEDVVNELNEKLNECKTLTDYDYLKLALTPLMANRLGLKSAMMNSVNTLKSIGNIDIRKSEIVTNVLILLTDKLFDGQERKDIEEALRMCDLVKQFIEEGKNEGERKKLIEIFEKKLKKNMKLDDIIEFLEIEENDEKFIREYFKNK
ncbi:MAG: hypothetical protein ACRDCW_10560, partial [Sarcina sp.]